MIPIDFNNDKYIRDIFPLLSENFINTILSTHKHILTPNIIKNTNDKFPDFFLKTKGHEIPVDIKQYNNLSKDDDYTGDFSSKSTIAPLLRTLK